jgi:HrpA-like RNA helicase
MEKAWSTLEELGALDENGRLTALGRHMVFYFQWLVILPRLNESLGNASSGFTNRQSMHRVHPVKFVK